MTEPTQTVEEFWAARDAHNKLVAAALRRVQDEINVGVDLNLYRDGLTGTLITVQQNVNHLADKLDPPAAPAPTPEPEA